MDTVLKPKKVAIASLPRDDDRAYFGASSRGTKRSRKGNYSNLLMLIAFMIVSLFSQAQVELKSEIGFGLGTFNYTGDLVRSYDFLNSQPAATVFYRSNISKVISMRTSLTGGKLAASDSNPIDVFAAKRANSFSIFLLEASAGFEYHFLDWRDTKRPLRFTPYIYAGAAIFIISGNTTKNAPYSNVQPAIPFGVGMKYVLNPNWYVSLEFAMRKTFFDYLDNVSDGNVGLKNYRYGNSFDNDNYFFLGFSVTRTFYNIPCAKSPY